MRHCLIFLCVASLFAADPSPWEEKFRAIPSPQNQRDYMQRLSARPHHVGSPYDKDNAEWIAARLKSWGLDATIETFDVLFPTSVSSKCWSP
jgi:N-acetylated-alpha-linked acidic dipeptidase